MRGVRLTARELERRQRIAARAELTRAEQAKLIGVTPQSWRQLICDDPRYLVAKRPRGKAAIRDREVRGKGLVYIVQTDHGKPRVALGAPVVRALGANVGDGIRARVDNGKIVLVVERRVA